MDAERTVANGEGNDEMEEEGKVGGGNEEGGSRRERRRGAEHLGRTLDKQ